ncbi:MAG: hypothetical protein QM667_05590, partial [Asticcacaulis sp.]
MSLHTPDHTPEQAAAAPLSRDQIVLDYGLRAQVRLLPYALGYFGIGLPLYIWSASLFLSAVQIVINLALFACVWTAFFLIRPGLLSSFSEQPDAA